MSGEREAWRIVRGPAGSGVWYIMGPCEDQWIMDVPSKSLADQIVREHNAYLDAIAALEKIVLTASSADDPMTVQQRWTKAVRLADAALQSIKEQGA